MMFSSLLSTALWTSSVALTPTVPSTEPVAEVRAAVLYPVQLVIDTRGLADRAHPDRAARTHVEVLRAILSALGGGLDVRPDSSPETAVLRVRLAWTDTSKSTYAVRVRAILPNGLVKQDTFRLEGDARDLGQRIEENGHTYVRWLRMGNRELLASRLPFSVAVTLISFARTLIDGDDQPSPGISNRRPE